MRALLPRVKDRLSTPSTLVAELRNSILKRNSCNLVEYRWHSNSAMNCAGEL